MLSVRSTFKLVVRYPDPSGSCALESWEIEAGAFNEEAIRKLS